MIMGVSIMLKTVTLAAAAVAIVSSSALADYYVVQEKTTKECRVVETPPTETTWIQVGPLAFKTRDEADRQVRIVCRERL
jgi:predicted small secreted protein